MKVIAKTEADIGGHSYVGGDVDPAGDKSPLLSQRLPDKGVDPSRLRKATGQLNIGQGDKNGSDQRKCKGEENAWSCVSHCNAGECENRPPEGGADAEDTGPQQ